MDTNLILVVLAALFTKHCVVDFLLQPAYMWMNKGTAGHQGGIDHSALHSVVTSVILLLVGVGINYVLVIAWLEFVVHYVTDWVKMNVNAKCGWACNKNEQFWYAVGVDQLVHSLTYIGIAYLIIGAV